MQATTVSIPEESLRRSPSPAKFRTDFTTAKFTLDREELMRLESMSIITGKAYIYLALKLSYDTLNISIDTESFCEEWQVTESDLAIALGQLQKKGALAPVHRQLELELF